MIDYRKREVNLKNHTIAGWILSGVFLMFFPTYAAGYNQPDEGFGKSYIVFPIVSSNSDTGTAYGLFYLSRQLSTSVLYNNDGNSMFFINTQSYLDDGRFLLSSSVIWRNWSSTFYGIGNENFAAPGEDYTGETSQLVCSLLVKFAEGVYLGPTVIAARYSVSDEEIGGQLAEGTIIGCDGADAVGIGLRLMSDQRDDPSFPTEGSLLDMKTVFYDPDYGSDQRFSQSSATYSKFIPVAMGGVLVLQGRIIYTHGDDIPFQLLPSLGDMGIMRGIEANKDINRNLAAVSGDYRFHIAQPLTVGIFVAVGDVAHSFPEIQMDKFVGGFEVRYNFMGPFKIYFIRGYSENDAVSYLGLNAGF